MVRISMSLCVNIIRIRFIAKIAINAMDALVWIYQYRSRSRIITFKLFYESYQFLFSKLSRQFNRNHFIGRYFIESKLFNFISHFLQAEVLSPQLINLTTKDAFEIVLTFYQQTLVLFIDINLARYAQLIATGSDIISLFRVLPFFSSTPLCAMVPLVCGVALYKSSSASIYTLCRYIEYGQKIKSFSVESRM